MMNYMRLQDQRVINAVKAWLDTGCNGDIKDIALMQREHPRTFDASMRSFARAEKLAVYNATAAWLKANPAPAKAPTPKLENKLVVAAVTEVANGFKDRLKVQIQVGLGDRVGQWEQKCKENPGKTDPATFWGYEGGNRYSYFGNQQMRNELSAFLNSTPRPMSEVHAETGPFHKREQHVYTLKPNWLEIANTKAEARAEAAVQGFIIKMSAKLQGILDAKGDFESVKVQGSLGQNYMVFSFKDGSRFTVTNDIILKTSCNGKLHNQYPTRFTGVMLGGERVSAPSEAKVKKLFVAGAKGQTEGWVDVIRSTPSRVSDVVDYHYVATGKLANNLPAEMTGRVMATPETAEAVATAAATENYGMTVESVKVSKVK